MNIVELDAMHRANEIIVESAEIVMRCNVQFQNTSYTWQDIFFKMRCFVLSSLSIPVCMCRTAPYGKRVRRDHDGR